MDGTVHKRQHFELDSVLRVASEGGGARAAMFRWS